MSGEAVGWAFRKVQMDDPTAKFVLVTICNYADANDKAWPSHNDISRVTGLSKRAVQNSIKKLVDWGVVQRVREYRLNGSESNPTVYLDLESRPVIVDGVASGTIPPVQENQPDIAPGASLQTTDIKPQKKARASKDDLAYSEDFESLWQAYPRTKNTSKKKAWDIYRMLNDENQARVRAAVPIFAAAMRAEGRPEDKIKHMEFWLSGRMYETVSAPAGASAGSAGPAKPFWETATRKQWGNALLAWSANWQWSKSWGPEPGQDGCHVPQDILDRFDLKYRGHLFSPEQKDAIQERVSKQAVDTQQRAMP